MKENSETLEAFKERLALARGRMLQREPFLGYLALELPTHVLDVEDDVIATAATDGHQYLYNYRWCRQLSDAELVFVVAHEVAHVLLLHVLRRNGRQAVIWNAACDFAVNDLLMRSCVEGGSLHGIAAMPCTVDPKTGRSRRIGLLENRFANWTSESIYDDLERNFTDPGVNWDQILEPASQQETNVVEAHARGALAKALIRAHEHHLRQGHRDIQSDWERLAEAGLYPTVQWQNKLRRYAQSWGANTVSWNRPNPKFRPHGFHLPRHRGYQLPNILFAFDTSGSVSDRFLGQMVSELNGLLVLARNSVVRVVCCDMEVHIIGDFHAGRHLDPERHKLHGGGGTDFRPVFDYAKREKNFRHLIYLTDTLGTYPETSPHGLSTLWLVPESMINHPPFGEVLPLPITTHEI